MSQASSEDMKIQAYVLVDTEFGTETKCAKQIEELSCGDYTLKTYEVYGVYDLVVELYAGSTEEVEDIVAELKRLDMVRSTVTNLIMYDKDAVANEE
jgi:DNA-binding Lrp family transcriptional regulator